MNPEAKKMDILLALKKKGYNLKDTEDPAVLSMDLGNGYTLLASVKREWLISFDDGIREDTYQIDSVKVPYTNSKDAVSLYKEFLAEFEGFVPDEENKPCEEYPIESFEEPEKSFFYPEDTTPSTIKLSDVELIKKIDVILHKTMPEEITYRTAGA